jgi:uncharacterized protein YerC
VAKVDYTKIPSGERQRMTRELAKFLLTIKEEKDMIQVLYRLLTRSEIVMLGRRLQIAESLLRGHSYQSIRDKLKVGFPTIRNVDSWLEHAVRDYDILRTKQRKEKTQRETTERSRQYGAPDIRYPGQNLLLKLLLNT